MSLTIPNYAPISVKGYSLSRSRWLLSPSLDLFFIASLYWPLLLVVFSLWLKTNQPITFLQVYLISSSHRWITLAMVFFDRDLMTNQRLKMLKFGTYWLLLGLILVGIAIYIPNKHDTYIPYGRGSLLLLVILDYVWNAWHFGAQHAGIARIYARVNNVRQSLEEIKFERLALRALVIWMFVRSAPRLLHFDLVHNNMLSVWFGGCLDLAFFIPAAFCCWRIIKNFRQEGLARVTYIGSVVMLYGGMLAALTFATPHLVTGLFISIALFHAGEYLCICFWSGRKKHGLLWQHPQVKNGVALISFIATVGLANWLFFCWSQYSWTLITLFVSLLHYGYDGIIWKHPRPAAVKLS